MQFEVIICTYNRPTSLLNLVKQIGDCSLIPLKIIVVDSSDQVNQSIKCLEHVTYVHSSHKNQPYQRYIGYLVSSAEVVVFLDDDLLIENYEVFKALLDCYNQRDVSGVSGGVAYESVITSAVNNTVDNTTTKFKILNFISGVPKLRPGKIYPMGLAGPLLKAEGKVEYFHGPFMSFKRTALHSLYDPILFNIFEQRLGMGEDKVISMKVGLNETLWYLPIVFFKHPPVSSHYYSDVRNLFTRTGFSRLFLSITYGHATNRSKISTLLHYYYFMCWRLCIAAVKYFVQRSPNRLATFQGYLDGVLMTFRKSRWSALKIDWKEEAINDAKQ